MAGTVTESRIFNAGGASVVDPVSSITLSWTSSAGGAADATTSAISGEILAVAFNPGATAPTAAYDVVITDADGVDVLAAQGANLSETTSTVVCPGVPLKDGTTTSVVPRAVNGVLTLAVTNAGNAKNGTVTIYFR